MAFNGPSNITMVPLHSSPTKSSHHHTVTDKFGLLPSPNSETTRSSCSSQSFEDALADRTQTPSFTQLRQHWSCLSRIEAVRVEHSIRKYGHRYYIVYVYLQSTQTPVHKRDPDYEVETPYASFFDLCDTVAKTAQRHATSCTRCENRTASLQDHRDSAHDLRRVLRTRKEKQERLERMIHGLLTLSTDSEHDAGSIRGCEGCQAACLALSNFLKRFYRPSTGII